MRARGIWAWALGTSLLSLLMVSNATANMISDGDFEGAGAGPWSTATAIWGSNHTFDFNAAGPTGQALRLYFPGGGGGSSFAAIQSFAVPAGVSSLKIDLDWRTVQGQVNGWYEILLQPAGSDYDAPAAGHILLKEEYGFGGPLPAPHGNWRHETFSNVPVTPGTNYQIALKMGGNPGTSNEAWFDNVVVLPEPGSLLLLGLASVFLMRRRSA